MIDKKTGHFLRTYKVNDKFLDIIGKEQAYFLGLMASDGCVKKNCFSISQSGEHGLKLINDLKILLKSNAKIYKYMNTFSINITSKKLVESLKIYNIVERKTLVYEFPNKLSKIYYKYFIRGYIDGDGCCGIYNSGTCDYLSISFVGTKNFIKDCYNKIPISGNICKIKRCKNLYDIRYNGRKAIKLGEWIW